MPWSSPSPVPSVDQPGPTPSARYSDPAPQATTTPPWPGPTPGPAPWAPGAGFAVAPQPGIIPLRPLSVTEILSGAFAAMRVNPRAMFLPSAVVMTVLGALTALTSLLLDQSRSADDLSVMLGTSQGTQAEVSMGWADVLRALAGDTASTVILGLLGTAAQALLTGLLIVTVSRAALGRIITPSEAWSRTRPRLPRLIGLSVLTTVLYALVAAVIGGVVVGTIALSVALAPASSTGVIHVILTVLGVLAELVVGALAFAVLWVRLALAPATLVLEGIGVGASLRRSWQLTRGGFWRILGALLLAVVITSALTSALTLVVTSAVAVIGGLILGASTGVIAAVIVLASSLASVVVIPFFPATCALAYTDQRMRREGLDVELRRAV